MELLLLAAPGVVEVFLGLLEAGDLFFEQRLLGLGLLDEVGEVVFGLLELERHGGLFVFEGFVVGPDVAQLVLERYTVSRGLPWFS